MNKDERNVPRMELRQTFWRCNDCRRIYTKIKIEEDIVTCIECHSTEISPVTIFEIVEKEKKEVPKVGE